MRTKTQRRQAQKRKKRRLQRTEIRPWPACAAVLDSESLVGRRGSLRQGMFYPELALGAGSLSYGRRLELQQFLVDVVRQRGCPLHLANLWNALYFHYDLDAHGFRPE